MKYCTHCGSQIMDQAVVCPNCGCPCGGAPQGGYNQNPNYNRNANYNQNAYNQNPNYNANPGYNGYPGYNGVPVNQYGYPASRRDSTLVTVVKVFMILGCITYGWTIIALAWLLPITISVFKKLNNGEPIGVGLKVCTLLFVNLIAGICLLIMED